MTSQKEANILLVEDTEEHAVLIRRALERGKLRPRLFWVTDGQAALDFLHNLGDYADIRANPEPDLILLDLKLPKLSGLEVLVQIKTEDRLRPIPVVVLTASDEGSDIIKCYQGGAVSYITKSDLLLNKGADPTAVLDTLIAMAGIYEPVPKTTKKSQTHTVDRREVIAHYGALQEIIASLYAIAKRKVRRML